MGMIAAELVEGSEKRDVSAREGVSYHTLVTWLVRRRRERPPAGPEGKAPVVHFAQVRLPRVSGSLEMVLPNGIVIRGADAGQVAALIKALGR
jgi:hypothetical protein